MCQYWSSSDIDLIWDDHSINLWNEWATSYHLTWNLWEYRNITLFDSKAVHIYIFLQKQIERCTHYNIDKIDSSIQTGLQGLVNKLFGMIDNRFKNKGNLVRKTFIDQLDKLKIEAEENKKVQKLNILIQNQKVLSWKKSIDASVKDIIKRFELKSTEEYDRNRGKYKSEEKRDLGDFDSKIILHSNRNILKTLEEKDKMIESIKKNSEADLKKWAEDKEKYYLEKYKNDMSKTVADARCKVENVQKELEFTHSYNTKEKQEMRKEIQELTFKLDDSLAQNKRLSKQLEINNRKAKETLSLADRDSVESNEEKTITLDWSNEEMITKYIQDESLKVMHLKITNFHCIQDKVLEWLNSFIRTKLLTDWETIVIESDGDKKVDILKYMKMFESLQQKILKSASFQGFCIDNQSLINIFESSIKMDKLSFKNCILDVGKDIKISEMLEFNISELEFIGVSPKNDKKSKESAVNLISMLKKTTLISSLKQVTLSQSNSFGSSLWESVKSEFKDQVETVITKDPWLFNDML